MKTILKIAAGIILAVVVLVGSLLAFGAYKAKQDQAAYEQWSKTNHEQFCQQVKEQGIDLKKAGCE